jgi:hypothetical protein
MCNLTGGWPRSQQAPVARKRLCNEDWALLWSRKGIARRPWRAGRAIMRTQAAVLRGAGSTCQRSQKDYPQFAEFTQY